MYQEMNPVNPFWIAANITGKSTESHQEEGRKTKRKTGETALSRIAPRVLSTTSILVLWSRHMKPIILCL